MWEMRDIHFQAVEKFNIKFHFTSLTINFSGSDWWATNEVSSSLRLGLSQKWTYKKQTTPQTMDNFEKLITKNTTIRSTIVW